MRMYSTPTNMKTIFIEICNIAPCRQQELLLCGHSFQGILEQIWSLLKSALKHCDHKVKKLSFCSDDFFVTNLLSSACNNFMEVFLCVILCSWWYNSHTLSCMVTLVHSCEKLMHLVLWIKPGAYQLVFSRSFTSAESLSWLFVSSYAGFIYQPKGLVPFLGFWPVCWTGILFQVIHWPLISISPCKVESPWDFWSPRILLQTN
jgi:hypothetical protein